jgi:hypothetical protein
MHMQDYDNMSVLYVLTKRKRFAKYNWRTYSSWKMALIPVVSSISMTYTTWLAYL